MLEWLQHFRVHDLDKLKTNEKLTRSHDDGGGVVLLVVNLLKIPIAMRKTLPACTDDGAGVHGQSLSEYIFKQISDHSLPGLSCANIYTAFALPPAAGLVLNMSLNSFLCAY